MNECEFECQYDSWQCHLEGMECEVCRRLQECNVCINSEICEVKEE